MLRDQLIELLQPVVADLGYELWELEYVSRRGANLLRLYIDTAAGITLDDCERVSRAVSASLDEADPITLAYTLEVSSPGLDRPLRTLDHFARFKGERIKLETVQPVDGRKRFAGLLSEVDTATGRVVLEVDGGQVNLPVAGIHKARVAPDY